LNTVLPFEADAARRLDITVEVAGALSNTLSIPIEQVTRIRLAVTPEEGFSATGQSASFAAGQNTKVYTLANTGSAPQSYTARADVPWLSVSPAAGNLGFNSTARVTVGLTSTANNLAAGTYSGRVTFASGSVTVTREATLVVTPIGECVDVGGQWFATESGSGTLTITALGETDTEPLRISGQGPVTIIQDGCSIRYTPVPVGGLFTREEAASLERTGSIAGNQVSVQGRAAVTLSAVPGIRITQVQENQYQASGEVVAGVLTLRGIGTFRASGTFSIEGQSGSFTATLNVSSSATLRRMSATSTNIGPAGSLTTGLRRVIDRIRQRESHLPETRRP
jgi:hypothetical protein